MSEEEIKRIIACALLAPSGENCQPWKFIAKGDSIEVFNVPERDQSLYNWNQRASFVANGAAIENILIAAKEEGFTPSIKFFPQKENINHIATIEFVKGNTSKDDLYSFISKRCTNRKKYKKTPLTDEQIAALTTASSVSHDCRFLYTQEENHREKLGMAGAMNEMVMLNNSELHSFFFSHVSWNKEEDNKKKMGFYLPTLELPPGGATAFKLFKHWSVISVLNKLVGLNKSLAKTSGKTYSHSAGFGIITVKDKTPQSFVDAGRTLQRLWLTATKLNLSLHPLTGILFFKLQLEDGNVSSFSQDQITKINNGYKDIKNIFNVADSTTIAFMFRIGEGGQPTARSSRYELENVSEII